MGRLPCSRCSFERVGHAVGQLSGTRNTASDDARIVALEIPTNAQSVSVGIDRVSRPMEEPRPRPVGRPRKDAPTRPVPRVDRMASCTTVTFHDATGTARHTIRHGAVPSVAPVDVCDRLLADAVAILAQRPDRQVVLLADGAPKMRHLLRTALGESTLGTTVYEGLDFWHVREKLAAAAQVVYGDAHGHEGLARWRLDRLNRNAAPDDILSTLNQSGRRHVRVGHHQPVHEAITSLEHHRDWLGDPGARRRGLPIGSGATEATCQSLFTVRLKRSGARWQEATAQDVINLRALALRDRWNPARHLTLAPLRKAVRAVA